ncbi:hypothetical protein MR626_00620 [bacterium]|nr:hypothetical protein [bacterium]
MKTYYVHIGFTRLLDKLVFDEWFVGRGHDPADQVPVFDRGSFNGIARKKLRFGGGEPPPYGMNEPFSVQPTDRKLVAGRRGHDISPTNYDNVKHQFIGLLGKNDIHIF